MWDFFKSLFQKWTFRNSMIREWTAVSLSLTELLISDLVVKTPSIRSLSKNSKGSKKSYNNDEPDQYASSSINAYYDPQISMESAKDQLHYSWHRTIYMIQNPVQLEPLTFQTAINVCLFLTVGRIKTG
jgi:hypothetical protein